jgi:hypothetical protein
VIKVQSPCCARQTPDSYLPLHSQLLNTEEGMGRALNGKFYVFFTAIKKSHRNLNF